MMLLNVFNGMGGGTRNPTYMLLEILFLIIIDGPTARPRDARHCFVRQSQGQPFPLCIACSCLEVVRLKLRTIHDYIVCSFNLRGPVS